MKTSLLEFLKTLRLFDPDGTLSWTSVALVVVLVKVALAPQLSLEELGAFLTAVSMYTTKKVINKDSGVAGKVEELRAATVATAKALHDRVQVVENRTSPINQVRR